MQELFRSTCIGKADFRVVNKLSIRQTWRENLLCRPTSHYSFLYCKKAWWSINFHNMPIYMPGSAAACSVLVTINLPSSTAQLINCKIFFITRKRYNFLVVCHPRCNSQCQDCVRKNGKNVCQTKPGYQVVNGKCIRKFFLSITTHIFNFLTVVELLQWCSLVSKNSKVAELHKWIQSLQ